MMCEFHDSNGNSLGDIWWTDKFIYFSIRTYRWHIGSFGGKPNHVLVHMISSNFH